jgi:hypothetical protein
MNDLADLTHNGIDGQVPSSINSRSIGALPVSDSRPPGGPDLASFYSAVRRRRRQTHPLDLPQRTLTAFKATAAPFLNTTYHDGPWVIRRFNSRPNIEHPNMPLAENESSSTSPPRIELTSPPCTSARRQSAAREDGGCPTEAPSPALPSKHPNACGTSP